MDCEEENKIKELKIVLLGDVGVGKTNIITRYLNNKFDEDSVTTNGASYMMKKLIIDDTTYTLNVWDTAGQEKFRSVTKMLIKGVNILILCYSIVDRPTFENLDFWYKLTVENCDKKFALGVVGNKNDLFENEEVKEEEGRNYAEKHKAYFKLISAKCNKNGIDQLFDDLLKEYITKFAGSEDEKIEDNNTLKLEEVKKDAKHHKKGCCK